MAVLDEFLSSLSRFLRAQDARQLQLYLRVEPPLPDHYERLKHELRTSYKSVDAIDSRIDQLVPDNDNIGPEHFGPWQGFRTFVKLYLEYWRDVDFDDLLGTFTRLTAVTRSVPPFDAIVLVSAHKD